jgi:type I restriction enzyme S subunit
MENEMTSIPKLRFPDFEGEWKIRKSKNLFVNSRSKGNETLPIFSVTQDKGLVPRNSLERKMKNDAKSEDNLSVEPEDLTYNMMRMWQGAVGIAHQKCMVSPAYIVLKPTQAVSSEFFIQFFNRSRSLYLFTSYSYGLTSDRLRLYFKDFASIKFATPTLPEQQKIASFLSAIDQKLQQFSRKKELLEQYKKGVMQKIFSREIRFQDENGNKYPAWQEKRLGDVLTFMSTNSLSRNDLTYESGEIKNIHYGDIHKIFKMGFDAAKEQVPYINRTTDLKKIPEEYFCQVGDVIIADASEDYNDIGKAIEIWDLSGEKIVAGLHTFLGRDKTGQTTNGFKGYLLQTSLVRKQIQKSAQGISVLGISKKNLEKVEFRLPCKKEQMKIVALLKSLDRKIETVQTQLAQTRTFKKGLLHQLFV